MDSKNIVYKSGALVRIKPEYLDPGERDIPYMVVEDRGDRILVQELREYSDQPLLGTWCWSKDCVYPMDETIMDRGFNAMLNGLHLEQTEQM